MSYFEISVDKYLLIVYTISRYYLQEGYMRAQHINITMPVDLKMRLDAESKRERIGRSTLIQKALSLYLDIIKKKKVRALLAEGYTEMAGEAISMTKEFEKLDDEAMGYAD
jgi:metal-responsive CopG/Arc/MetJ family transcriptional regulator